MVQQSTAALLVLLAAPPPAEPEIASGRALQPLCHCSGAADQTVYPRFPIRRTWRLPALARTGQTGRLREP